MTAPMSDDFFFTLEYDDQLNPFWPDLFSSNRKLSLSPPTRMPYTTITQHHISNQIFPLPYVSSLGREADNLMADALAKGGNEDADMMDINIVEEFFDFGMKIRERKLTTTRSLHCTREIVLVITPHPEWLLKHHPA
jgi:hypothetical protein